MHRIVRILALASLAALTPPPAFGAPSCTIKGLGHVKGLGGAAFNLYDDATHLMLESAQAPTVRIEVATTRWVDGRHAVVTGLGVRCGDHAVTLADPRAAGASITVTLDGERVTSGLDGPGTRVALGSNGAGSIERHAAPPGRAAYSVSCAAGGGDVSATIHFILQPDPTQNLAGVRIDAGRGLRKRLDGACGWGKGRFRPTDVKQRFRLGEGDRPLLGD